MARRVLQDVHRSVGDFGCFPTYVPGNILGAALATAMPRDLPDLGESLVRGELAPARSWQSKSVHRHGRLETPTKVIEGATGRAPSTAPLIADLEEKYRALYGL